jgi:hypothetical protein
LTRGQRQALAVLLIATAFGLGLQTGCVTRVQVCVEAQHADGRWRDSAGASVCADVER